MNQFLIERKAKKREEKIEFYSAVSLVVILTVITLGLEILWMMKISQ